VREVLDPANWGPVPACERGGTPWLRLLVGDCLLMDTEDELGTTGSELVPDSAPLGVLRRCSATPIMILCRISSFSLKTIAVVGPDVVWL